MPKVKLVKIEGRYSGYFDDYYSDNKWVETLIGFIPEEDISYDDYDDLKSYVRTYNKSNERGDTFFLLFTVPEQDDRQLIERTHKEFIEAERKRREKQEEAERKRKETLAAKALETKRKKLEKLKKELGEVT